MTMTQTQIPNPYLSNPYWQRIYRDLRRWIADTGLEQGRVLEVGCGLGLLQDLVPDYTGIDILPHPKRTLHKPFCRCNATRLPFPDNSFDGAWSIWVLEHVCPPEDMLREMRRVVKPGGHVFFSAVYAIDSWISQGLHKRPFRDLSLRQKLIKLTIPVRSTIPYKIVANLPWRTRDLLSFLARRQPTSVRYGRLAPNYETYWDYDADACAALDAYNVALYFLSRGDKPYYRRGVLRGFLLRSQPQAYTIRKEPA